MLNLKKRNLAIYDIEVLVDRSRSMFTKDCPNGRSRWDHARGWASQLVKEAEAYDDDGVTTGFFDNETTYYENTTFDRVAHVFNEVSPRGSTDTALVIRERCADYLTARLGKPGGVFRRGTPANPKQKPRIILVVTDGIPDDQAALRNEIVEVTKRMTAGGLSKDDLVISFVQVGHDEKAKRFLDELNNGLGRYGATLDIVGCITCDQAMTMTTQQVLEAALDAE
jgi:hypothetical protein